MGEVIVASDICLFRMGLASILSNDGRLICTSTAKDEHDLFRLLRLGHTAVALIDMGMPRAYPACRSIHENCPDIKIIALCITECVNEIGRCAESGVAGFVSREGSIEELIETVYSALRGELACSKRVAALLLNKVNSLAFSESVEKTAIEHLTPREVQVAELIGEGMSNKQIAHRLNITVSTTKNHVHNLLEKLGAARRTEAAVMFRKSISRNVLQGV